MALSYYNDEFDLKVGDRVYVDGKLEGQLGYITGVSYNFKIKLSDHKKVIAVVDTEVHGQFFLAGSHFIAFDPAVLPKEQIALWFKAPAQDDEEYVSKIDLAKRQTWGELNPVIRKPQNSKTYNHKRTQERKKELPNPASVYFITYFATAANGKSCIYSRNAV
jgi:hypothetical protein